MRMRDGSRPFANHGTEPHQATILPRSFSFIAQVALICPSKSQIAIEYCYQYKDCHPSHSVLWAHGGTIAKFDQAYKDIARNLSLPGWDDPLADTLQLVTDWLNDESHGHWLLVLDNADDKEIFFGAGSGQQTNQATRLSQYLPISQRGAILVTTRDKRVAELICDGKTAISVPVLGPEQSAAMLQSRLSKHQWNAGDASDLLARLDNLPLAITQAAAFIKNNYISINEYLDMLRKSKSEAVDLLLEGLTDPRRDLDAPSSVIQTWKISFDQIQNKEPRAAELLSFIAVLDRQGIPKFLLSKEDESTIELTSALGTLQAFSLITAETGGTSFEMHRLVQLSTRKWLKLQGDISRWQEEALTQLSRTFPNGNYETWVMCEKLLPHAHTVLEYQMAAEPDRLAHAFLLHNMAIFELQHWHYELAFGYCDKAHAIREELLGMNHQDTLNSASTLVRILTEQEKYGEAEELNQKILEQRQSTLGMEHDDTLDSLYDLGYVLYHQEKYEEAECLHRQVLACREQRLGPQHRKSLQSMNNLALVLGDRGKYEAAEQLFRQVLQEYGEIYGLQHPRILTIMDNLAWTLRKQSKFEEAEQMLQQVVKISEKMLGPHNPKTLNSLNDLGLVLDGSGKHNAAEKMHRQVLEIRREALGPQNRDILISMHNLAIALDNQGRNEAAEQMYRQVLEVQEKRYGLEDTSTQITVYNLAFSLRRQKRFDEAETMLRQALTLAEETQGLLALRTLDVVFELAVLCNDQGDLDQAIELMQRAHDGFQKEFGVDPPGTRDSAGWLSLWVKTEKEGVKIESETGSESTADS